MALAFKRRRARRDAPGAASRSRSWRFALAVPSPASAQAAGPRPLVMPFEASSTEPRGDWLGELASVAITREFRAAGVSAIRRDDRLQAMERLRVPDVPLLSHATVIRLASVVGATVVAVGRVEATAAELVLRARTIRVDTGFMADEIVERGPARDLFRDRRARRAAHRARDGSRRARRPWPRAPGGGLRALRPQPRRHQPATRISLLTDAIRAGAGARRRALCLVGCLHRAGRASAGAYRGARRVGAGDTRRARVPRSRLRAAARALSGGVDRFQHAAEGPRRRGARQRHGRGAAAAPGSGPKATDLFRDATALDAERRDPLLQSRIRAWIAREYPQAVAALRDAVRRSPADEDAHYVLGAALQAAGSADEGAREKDLARRLSSVYQRSRCAPHGQLGTARTGAAEDAIDATSLTRVESALSAAGQREQRELVSFYLTNGRRLYQAERDADALAELRRAVFLSPYESEAHLLIGRILLRGGGPREAIDTLKISVWSRDTPAARLALAEAYVAAASTPPRAPKCKPC
jgi:tetratricopeptide (TPR) repeat protein